MRQFIDRTRNPSKKSIGNRQRFMRRAHAQLRELVNQSVSRGSVADVAEGGNIKISSKGIREPRLRHSLKSGTHSRVLTGNREFLPGDIIQKPQQKGGKGGTDSADHGDGEDDFLFALTRDEFLDIFFEDLELPDLVKTSLREADSYKPRRAGFATSGTPTNINLLRTVRNAIGRRLSLGHPKLETVQELERQIALLEEKEVRTQEEILNLDALKEELEGVLHKRRRIPYFDPLDVRYNRFEQHPEPNTRAVMFCLMDVSGSMGEREKDLAKRFFILLHLFLTRRYKKIDVVFIRHTHKAKEVSEEEFFYSQETGGTVVSTAFHEMLKIQKKRYSTHIWNIYVAQASDGDNFSDDMELCEKLLGGSIMPLCQHFAFVEILDKNEKELFMDEARGKDLWLSYRRVLKDWKNLAMTRISDPKDIYPVFRKLFGTERRTHHARK